MIIHLHVAMAGTLPFRRQVKIKAKEGATVDEILAIYRTKYKADHAFGRMSGLSVLVNGARGDFSHTLKDQDRVKIFRPMVRG